MNTKYNFGNCKFKASKFSELDTNPSHYKNSSFTHNRTSSLNSYTKGVAITYINGQTFKTKDVTVESIYEALAENNNWLRLKNGGCINLNHVTHFEPYKFFDRPRDEMPAPWTVGHAPKVRNDHNA
ncbi:hypothetical protein [Lactobacillus crispatus]|uniref:hypothetical protein n=1 Tax=Lactobacillus crispatus TaxID=47770 RepID=UPI001F094E65|nr:hypothetical protein [Lactobacillus crispatus]